MNWLNRFKVNLGYEDRPHPVSNSGDLGDPEAIEALEKATQAVGQAHRRRAAFEEVTTSLNRLNVRNHFGESIEIAMMRKEKRA